MLIIGVLQIVMIHPVVGGFLLYVGLFSYPSDISSEFLWWEILGACLQKY